MDLTYARTYSSTFARNRHARMRIGLFVCAVLNYIGYTSTTFDNDESSSTSEVSVAARSGGYPGVLHLHMLAILKIWLQHSDCAKE